MDVSRLEEAVAPLCEHGMMEEVTWLLSGDDSFLGFTGLLLESEQKKRVRWTESDRERDNDVNIDPFFSVHGITGKTFDTTTFSQQVTA